ncbi:MAG TPA: lysophospholipid acyltransferase family protein [Dehalococcoidia bacterium]|nr:lysophospholipid acyltransferase family protein [Dehalococcoidia bacterium]
MTDTHLTSAERRVQADLVEAKPHRWALSMPARLYRRALRRWDVDKHIKAFCHPLTIEGRENLDEATSPLLIIANHTSHFDTVIILHALPRKIWGRTAIVAAADRMYRDKVKGMLHSLRYNAFPITRGGGREALAYSQWLLHNHWSLLIFPEGARSRDGEMLPFRGGPAILALGQHVPILPMHIDGASHILPPGEKFSRPAPVHVSIGRPFVLEQGTSIPEAKARMEAEVRALKPA